jgi:hypothetical protein
MPWFQEFPQRILSESLKQHIADAVCGTAAGIVKGAFGLTYLSESEVKEVMSLKELALSTIKKAPEFVTDTAICEGIKKGQQAALDEFANKASPEMVAAGVVTAAELVCNKSFKARFASFLAGACLNLVGC